MKDTNKEIVKKYFALFFSPEPDFHRIRSLLSDSFTFSGPLLKANSADDYITKISHVADGGLSIQNAEFVSQDGHVVVIYDMISPLGEVRTVEWFKIDKGKIQSLELVNDPKIFVEAFSNE